MKAMPDSRKAGVKAGKDNAKGSQQNVGAECEAFEKHFVGNVPCINLAVAPARGSCLRRLFKHLGHSIAYQPNLHNLQCHANYPHS